MGKAASDFENADQKVTKIKRLVNKSGYEEDVERYIPGSLNLMCQGMIENKLQQSNQPARCTLTCKRSSVD